MGGRSSSFKSRKSSGVPTLYGSKDQIAQAEKIRKPYADALKNLDEDTIYKGIRVNRGETSEQAMKNGIAKTCIDTIFREIGADVFQIDVEHLINTEIKKSGVDFSSMYDEMILGKKEKLYEAAAKVEEQSPENAAVLRKIAHISSSTMWYTFIPS